MIDALCDGFLDLPYRVGGWVLQGAMCRRLVIAADGAHQQGRYARAAMRYRQALELAERYGAEDRWWAATYTRLAITYSRLGRYVEAEALHRRALEIFDKARHLEQPRIAGCLSNLGALCYHQGKYAEAEAFYQRSLMIQESVLGPAHPEMGVDLNNLGAICAQQRRYDEAEALIRRALAMQEQGLGADHPDVAATLNNLACLYQEQGRSAEAESLHRRALSAVQSRRGRTHPEVAPYLNNLASYCMEQGKEDAAEPLYRRALAIRKKALGPAHPDLATSLENYAGLLSVTLRSAEAERRLAQAKAIRARHAEELLTRRWSALPISAADPGGAASGSVGEEPPDWVARLSAAAASAIHGGAPPRSGSERLPGPPPAALERGAESAGASLSPAFAVAGLHGDELRRALERNELQVYYQPIVSLDGGQITGAEALLRWQHPRRGLLSPREFVPLAEETGLILNIGERLLRDACAQRALWSQTGHPNLRLHVNLSPSEFQDDRLPGMIQDVLGATGTAPDALHLDISERAALGDVESCIAALRALAANGLRIALDDAGADSTLLLHLDRLPLHAVKLEGAQVRRMAADPEAAARIDAVIAAAHRLELTVIALGVETEEQLALVRARQCDEVQGYLFRRPAPAELFTVLLQKERCFLSELLMEEHLTLECQPALPAAAHSLPAAASRGGSDGEEDSFGAMGSAGR